MKANGYLWLLFFLSWSILAWPISSHADNDPRDYLPAPAGTNVCTLYYQHAKGQDLYIDGSRFASDYEFDLDVVVAKYTTYRTWAEQLVVVQAALPWGRMDLAWPSGGIAEETSGLGDPVILAGFWPWSDQEKMRWLGLTAWVTMPLGSYDENRVLNLGANRFAFKLESNFSFSIRPGLIGELAGNIEFYTDNDSYLGSKRLAQDPILTLEGHLSYNLSSSVVISGDYFYHAGGETEISGTEQNNPKDDHALMATLSYQATPSLILRVLYRNDFAVKNGAESQTAGCRILKLF